MHSSIVATQVNLMAKNANTLTFISAITSMNAKAAIMLAMINFIILISFDLELLAIEKARHKRG